MAENGGFGDDFQHLFTGVNGVGKRGARASTGRDWAAEMIDESVKFCDIV
jgi:hypothetical protein